MTDADSESVDDVQNTLLPDDSCVLQLIEIVPLDRPYDDYCKPEFIDPVVEVKTEDLKDVKEEPDNNYDIVDPCFTIQVRCAWMYVVVITLWYVWVYNNWNSSNLNQKQDY